MDTDEKLQWLIAASGNTNRHNCLQEYIQRVPGTSWETQMAMGPYLVSQQSDRTERGCVPVKCPFPTHMRVSITFGPFPQTHGPEISQIQKFQFTVYQN